MKTFTNFPLMNADEEIEAFIKAVPSMLGDYDSTPSTLRFTTGPYEGRFVEPGVAAAWSAWQVRAHRAQQDQAEAQRSQNLLVKTLDELVNGAGAAPQARLVDIVAQFASGNVKAFSKDCPPMRQIHRLRDFAAQFLRQSKDGSLSREAIGGLQAEAEYLAHQTEEVTPQ